MSVHDAISRYLVGSRPELGPIGLLRLEPADLTDEAIEHALARELARINRHPQSGDPLAEDARRALHVAAAQLRDPAIRSALLAELSEQTGASPRPASVEPARPPAMQPRPRQEFSPSPAAANTGTSSRPLLQPLDPFSSPRSAKRGAPITIALFAASIVMAVGLVVVLARTGGSSPGSAASPASGGGSGATSTGDEAPAADVRSAAILAESAGSSATSDLASVPSSLPPAPSTAQECVALFKQAETLTSSDTEHAARVFRIAAQWLGEHWHTFDAALLTANIEQAAATASLLLRTSERAQVIVVTSLDEMAEPLERRDKEPLSDSIGPAVLGAGLLSRIARDPTLPIAARDSLKVAIGAAIGEKFASAGADFSAAAAEALRGLAILMVPQPGSAATDGQARAAWSIWAESALAASQEPAEAQRLILDAAERLMLDGAEPTEDPRVHAAISALLARAAWSDDQVVQPRVIAWFDDARYSNADLSEVTLAAHREGAPGVTPALVLPAAAGSIDRSITRESLVVAWGLGIREESREAAERWLAAARQALARADSAASAQEHLAAAACLARLNEAAAWRWAQQPEQAGMAMNVAGTIIAPDGQAATPASPISRIAPVIPGAPMNAAAPSGGGSSTWAARYLAVPRSPEARLGLLVELRTRGGELDAVDAEVLAEAACFGMPREVRRMAQRAARDHPQSPAMLLGLLEALPRAARQPDVSEMIEELTLRGLPKPTDQSWVFEARRAVVERVLELLLPGAGAPVDQMASHVESAYAAQCDALGAWGAAPAPAGDLPTEPVRPDDAATTGPGAQAPPQPVAPDAGESATLLADHWHRQGERLVEGPWAFTTLDRIARRASARLSLADGPVQRFLSEQIRLLECMAYVVAAERESRAAEVAALVEIAARRRRGASHVFAQVAAVESAMTRLWIIRGGEAEHAPAAPTEASP